MTVFDKTKKGQTEALAFEFDLRHPPERVWRALTDPELLQEWLLPVVGLQLEPGAEFIFQREPMPGWDGKVRCRMLEIEEQRKISYTWIVGDMDTVVTFTLEPTPTGTQLSLLHSGFKPEQKQNFGGARYGWNLMGKKLLEILDEAA